MPYLRERAHALCPADSAQAAASRGSAHRPSDRDTAPEGIDRELADMDMTVSRKGVQHRVRLDDADFERLGQHNWYIDNHGYVWRSGGYHNSRLRSGACGHLIWPHLGRGSSRMLAPAGR